MTASRKFELSCACGKEFEATLWDSINVTEEKELKTKLLTGEINQVQCPYCKKRTYIEKNLLYHDMEQKLWIHMLPSTERSKWEEIEEKYIEDIKKNLAGKKYHFRLAFGREELLEKVKIFDADLDDRIIEILKIKILEEDEKFRSALDLKLFFSRHIVSDEELHFSVSSQEKEFSQTVVISFSHYEDLVESKEYAKHSNPLLKTVCSGMYINIHKMKVLH